MSYVEDSAYQREAYLILAPCANEWLTATSLMPTYGLNSKFQYNYLKVSYDL
jgi:hypothetical protein